MRLDLTRLFRTAEAEPARTDEPWMQRARTEGITEDEISRVAKMDIEYPIFFARMLHGNEIDPAHFEDESRTWLQEFKTFKQNFAPKTLNEMYKLSDLTTKLTEIQDAINKMKGGGRNWFDPQGQMKRLSVVKSSAHVYEVYRYDNWHTQRKLLAYPAMICVSEMPMGSDEGGNEKNRQYMEQTYGGIYNVIVKDGKQWSLMAVRYHGDAGFTKIDNSRMPACERAIATLVAWDDSGVWQADIVDNIKNCTDSNLLSEIKSLTKGLPDAAQKEIKTYYLLRSRTPERLMEILLQGNLGRVELDDDDKDLLAEAKESIQQGTFAWTVALKPFIENVSKYKSSQEQVVAGGGGAATDAAQNITRAKTTFAGIKYALDSQKRASNQALAKIRREQGRDPSDDEKIAAYAPLNALRQYLTKPEIIRSLITPAQYVDEQSFKGLLDSAESSELPELTAVLKDALVFKLASMKKRLSQHENAILSTGNHHAIRYYYQNAVRGDTGARLAPGGGLSWPAFESFIIDEIMRGNRDGEVRDTIRDYLSKVENPAARVEIMKQAAEGQGGDRAVKVMESIERMLPAKMRGQPTRTA